MMHARTPDSVKETVLNSMADNNGLIRVLICTIAFGMGVDAKGVRNIINFWPFT
jgi:superfamily II DNA helicase RecQ